MKRVQVFVPVSEDWYGNFKIDKESSSRFSDTRLIQVSLLELHDHTWRVCAWGNDDFGLERDFPADEYEGALDLYIQIVSESLPTQKWLTSLGMTRA